MAEEKMTLIERLTNPSWEANGKLSDEQAVLIMAEAAERIKALKTTVAEMVKVYWGEGDGDPTPPACIQAAQKELAAD